MLEFELAKGELPGGALQGKEELSLGAPSEGELPGGDLTGGHMSGGEISGGELP